MLASRQLRSVVEGEGEVQIIIETTETGDVLFN